MLIMDHIDNILSSDLIERYIAGNVTSEESLKVDLLKVEHPAIRAQIRKLEQTGKHHAPDHPNNISTNKKECIIKNISGGNTSDAPPTSAQSLTNYWWKVAAALVIGIMGTWIVMQDKVKVANETILESEADMSKLEKDYEQLNEQYAYINHSDTKPYMLDGQAFGKESQVIIYWNEILERSKLRVLELPSISSNQTYQLWADVDGQMISIGVFDPSNAIEDAIDMGYLNNASSLNITVEPTGGSQHPTIQTLTASLSI